MRGPAGPLYWTRVTTDAFIVVTRHMDDDLTLMPDCHTAACGHPGGLWPWEARYCVPGDG